jgi:hypothetical protein
VQTKAAKPISVQTKAAKPISVQTKAAKPKQPRRGEILKLSLIIPVSHELERATDKLRDVISFWQRFPVDLEILLVQEPSEYDTGEAWRELIQSLKPPAQHQFRLEQNERKLGRGGSIQRGLSLATGEILGVLSFDLSIPLGDVFSGLQEFIMHRNQDFIVVGNRRSSKKKRRGRQSRLRKVFEEIEHEKAAALQIPDPTCPFFMLKKETWEELQPIKLRRWFYTPGLILAARKGAVEVRSLDVQCLDHAPSRMSPWDLWR